MSLLNSPPALRVRRRLLNLIAASPVAAIWSQPTKEPRWGVSVEATVPGGVMLEIFVGRRIYGIGG